MMACKWCGGTGHEPAARCMASLGRKGRCPNTATHRHRITMKTVLMEAPTTFYVLRCADHAHPIDYSCCETLKSSPAVGTTTRETERP